MTPRTTAAGRRRLSRTPAYARRDRRELFEAVAAVVVILAFTGLCVWAMRPDGIAGRQPRAVLLGLIVLAVFSGTAWLLTAPERRFAARRLAGLAIAAGLAVVITVVGVVAWPGGVVIDEPTPTTLVRDPITDTVPPPGEPPPAS